MPDRADEPSYRPFIFLGAGLLALVAAAGLALALDLPVESLFPALLEGEQAVARGFRLLGLLLVTTIVAFSYALLWLGLHVRRLFRESQRLQAETKALAGELRAAGEAVRRLERERASELGELRRAYQVDRQRLEDTLAVARRVPRERER